MYFSSKKIELKVPTQANTRSRGAHLKVAQELVVFVGDDLLGLHDGLLEARPARGERVERPGWWSGHTRTEGRPRSLGVRAARRRATGQHVPPAGRR